jgi:hypothetical protein
MLYELRVYTALPGRMPALIKRFETKTLGFWQQHGIRQVGFFTTAIGPHSNALTYILAWESLAEREKKWHALETDAEFSAGLAGFVKDGPMLASLSNQLLMPTEFSALK